MISRRALLLSAGSLLTAGNDYDSPGAIYRALRTQPAERLDVPGGQIDIVFADGAPGLDRQRVRRWIELGARAVSTYYGRYPTQRHGLLIIADNSDRVGGATTWGYNGSITRVHVGREATEAAFAKDWVLVHEMVHTAIPDMPRRALWFEEGNATWIEPIARAQAKQLTAAEMWNQALKGMPQGIRGASAGGMDGTQEWGRLYWGGAIFWMLAEIAVYEQSRGRALLRDALRAINREAREDSTPEQVMARGDTATGTSALQSQYKAFAFGSPRIDLAATFKRLGVARDSSGAIRFDSSAELASLTSRITQA